MVYLKEVNRFEALDTLSIAPKCVFFMLRTSLRVAGRKAQTNQASFNVPSVRDHYYWIRSDAKVIYRSVHHQTQTAFSKLALTGIVQQMLQQKSFCRVTLQRMVIPGLILLLAFGLTIGSALAGSASRVRPQTPSGGDGPLVHATFSGPEDQPALPRTDTGQNWQVFSGAWGVLHHRAYNARNSALSKSGDGNDVAVVNAGVADCNVRATLSGTVANPTGLAFRASDAQNFFFVRAGTDSIEVFRKTAGNYIRLAKVSSGVADGDTLEVELRGNSIVIRVNGAERVSLIDSFNQRATRHGLYSYDANVSFSEFAIDTRAAAAEWVRITSPKPYQTFQRDDSGHADIQVNGLCSGNPKFIEARFNGGSWTAIGSPKGNQFSGKLLNQDGGQGALEVRFSDKPTVTFTQNYVGVGEVFLVAGQSNAEGRITAPQSYSHPRLRASVYDQTIGWRDGYDPTDSSLPNEYSVWPLLATKVMAATNLPVAFITSAEPQTGLIGDGGTWAKGGPTYEKCLKMVRDSGANSVRAVLWYQGESDANIPSMTQAQYTDALLLMRRNLAADLGWPLKLMTAQIAYMHTDTSKETRTSVDAVRLAQAAAPDKDANILMGPVLYDLNLSAEAGGDGVHVQTPAHAQIEAARWWHMLNFYFFKGPGARGPRCESSTADGRTIDVRFINPTGSLHATSGIESGWRVSDAHGPHKVVSAVIREGSIVRLTLDQPVSGRAEIFWASYNDAAGLSLTDSSVDAMPAEPCRLVVP